VTAHEFWHLWNVKRLRPRELGPFDYQRVTRTPSLWWSEGVTDYFAAALLRRSGLRDSAAAVRDLAGALESYLDNPASARVSPERSSETAWDPPAVNGGYSVSYYLQGKLLGELLELRLRAATGARRGMDDVMRRLYDAFAGARGFAPADVERAVAATCAEGAAPRRRRRPRAPPRAPGSRRCSRGTCAAPSAPTGARRSPWRGGASTRRASRPPTARAARAPICA
jgi:predicted metalloprotease with PDZ domain